jgi:hypothetical protein
LNGRTGALISLKREGTCSLSRGRLGIQKMNSISLLFKWWWRLENEKGFCQDVIRAKYLQNEVAGTVTPKMEDSPVG